VLDAFARALPHTLRTAIAPDGTVVRLAITGEAGGAWTAIREGNRWRPSTDHDRAANATVAIDQDLAWRLFTKGVTPADAERSVRIEGDRSLGAPVLTMVSIIA
jgi:hypothetical protein